MSNTTNIEQILAEQFNAYVKSEQDFYKCLSENICKELELILNNLEKSDEF